MSNPIYHDDPDWYERPGETVHLTVDQHPSQFTVPILPWMEPQGAWEMVAGRRVDLAERNAPTEPCPVCTKPRPTTQLVCDFCARAQAADETHKARVNIPQPSSPRIHIREGWEVYAASQPKPSNDLESGHVREHETRIG